MPLPVFILIILVIFAWPLYSTYRMTVLRRILSGVEKLPSAGTILLWSFKNKEILRRFGITLLCCGLVAVVQTFPFPLFHLPDHLGMASMLMPIPTPSFFLLGISPLLWACLILQTALFFIPSLKKNVNSRANLVRLSLITTFILSFGISLFTAWQFDNLLELNQGFQFQILFALTVTASVGFLLLVANMIEKFGIGNGVACIFITLILPSIISSFHKVIGNLHIDAPLTLIPISLFLLWLGYFSARKVGWTHFTVNGNTPADIPFRPTLVGDIPRSLALFFIVMPETLAQFSHSTLIRDFAGMLHSWIYFPLLIILLIIFTFVFAAITFNSSHLQTLMEKFDYQHKGEITSSKQIDRKMSLILLTTLLIFILSFVTQWFLGSRLHISHDLTKTIAGWPMILLGGFIADLVTQLDFYKKVSSSGLAEWSIIETCDNETEALIKAADLNSKKIPALVKSSRFSWGMPAQTLIDQHQIYSVKNGSK